MKTLYFVQVLMCQKLKFALKEAMNDCPVFMRFIKMEGMQNKEQWCTGLKEEIFLQRVHVK